MVLNMKHFRWLAIAMTICCVMTSMAQAAKNEGLQLTEQIGRIVTEPAPQGRPPEW